MDHREVEMRIDQRISLQGILDVPSEPRGLVLFVHGSGSSRRSPRNLKVAAMLQQAGFATLLFDLLTAGEERFDSVTGELRFDIPFLSGRLLRVTEWAALQPALRGLHIGYFGASTGAAAALSAAADTPRRIFAIVSRGGRPDLASQRLSEVRAPTLLIVGSKDEEVLALNERARSHMKCDNALEVISGAAHLFEEHGALDEVALLASEWFREYLPPVGRVIDLRSYAAARKT